MTVDIAAIRAAAAAEGVAPAPWEYREGGGFCGCDENHGAPGECPQWNYEEYPDVTGMFTVDQGEYMALSPATAKLLAMLDPQTVLALCDLAERPTPPLAADVLAAVERIQRGRCDETCGMCAPVDMPACAKVRLDNDLADIATLIAAVQAVAGEWARLRAENERLKAACALALDWCETDNDSIERLAEEVAPALRTALHGEASDGR